MSLQVLLAPSRGPLVAGLPPALRAARRAQDELQPARIVFAEEPEFAGRFRRQLETLPCSYVANGQPVGQLLNLEAPLLALSSAGFPDDQALASFVKRARREGKPAAWASGGEIVAAYWPRARQAPGRPSAGETAHAALAAAGTPLEAPGWTAVHDLDAAENAERALCVALSRDTDGFIARFDRRLSIALSRRLLKTSVTPNMITAASLVLGLAGSWWLASGSWGLQALGAWLLWFCCILDGCDGEVARLKMLSSQWGATFDLWADHLVHLTTFVAIPVGVWRSHPETNFWLPGVLLVTGFLGCAVSVWWLVLRKPDDEREALDLFVERVASRDYAYLILAFALAGRLDWFLWAAAVGSHAFWVGLWWISSKRSR